MLPLRPPNLGRTRRRGFAVVELVIVLVLVLVATQALLQSMIGARRHRTINRENSLAAEAAHAVLEDLRGVEFDEAFRLYNAALGDDPDGVGTAPGARFDVSGLDPPSDSPDGLNGTVVFAAPDGWPGRLHEDVDLRALGFPRDLNGDGGIDGANHAGDYTILPVQIVVRWRGAGGDTEYRVTTSLVGDP